jgi:hypothetical protein
LVINVSPHSLIRRRRSLYEALLTANPTTAQQETQSGTTEASYSGYARQPYMPGTITGSGDDASTPTTMPSANATTFAAWAAGGSVYAIDYFLTLTGGAARYYDDSFSTVTIGAGAQPTFAIAANQIVEK